MIKKRIEKAIAKSTNKDKLNYVYDAFINRKLRAITETAIFNIFIQVIENDSYYLDVFFEQILDDCFTKEAKEYHLDKFNEL